MKIGDLVEARQKDLFPSGDIDYGVVTTVKKLFDGQLYVNVRWVDNAGLPQSYWSAPIPMSMLRIISEA